MSRNDEKRAGSARMREILDAIPGDLNRDEMEESLGNLIEKLSVKKVPVSSLTRMWILGSMKARIAIGYLAYVIRSNFIHKSEKQRLLNETNLKAALKLFATMGYLRGTVMKLGQILGNLPGTVPVEIAEVMSTLQFDAPPMHFSMIREILLDELGKEPEEIFQSFERKAFAAASFGQVHRARLKTGEEVAVKIQYPGMQETIHSDLRNLRILLQPMRLKKEHKYLMSHVEDAEKMLMLETDYYEEGRYMEQARALFNDEDCIVIPRYYEEYSSRRVLTMDYIPGCHLPEFLSSRPHQKLRNRYGELISKAYIRIWVRTRRLYTDLNPGNFLFMDDGRLGMIDFGSYRTFSEHEWELQKQTEKAILANDTDAEDEGYARVCFCDSVGDMDPVQLDIMRRYAQWQIEPILGKGAFDFGNRDFFRKGIDIVSESMKRGYSRYDSLYNWWNRSIIGHRTILHRLGSCFNYDEVYKNESSSN